MSVADYEPVIGLEVHCQLATRTKMFSGCPQGIGEPPNTMVDAYTLGLPGTLPVPNAQAIRYGIALALALGCELQPVSRFARKHYFYPDLPKGYQITQADRPYALGGAIEIEAGTIRLHHIHFEEDAGKNIHVAGEDVSLVDFNRAGAPLLEIVGEPDLRCAADAAEYLRALRAIVRTLGISEANMEQGTLRCDANVSLRRRGTEPFGTRCEIKNLNSFRFLERAIDAEIRRQADLLDHGEAVVMATMSFDADRNTTKIMRTKEEAADYRYLPEPDLPPLILPEAWIEELRAAQPELPAARRERYRDAGLSGDDAKLLVEDPELAAYFDAVVAEGADTKAAANWVSGELLAKLDGASVTESNVGAAQLAELIGMVADGTVSGRSAKQVFSTVWTEGGSPRAVAERDGHRQVSDTSVLEAAVA
ncbi:MAG: Asp-tRNA(Asn)/Glu-tRNA(Gln) amidotransferase subunit GatB, partial [Myxococcota bacterium]